MEQHPIPQQISSYQFRLVGDMTLKQFFQIAGGALVSLLIYSTELHAIIKWPLVLISALFGVALAFLPFEERPLDRWIVAFFKAVYSPTIFNWKAGSAPKQFFKEDAPSPKEELITSKGEEELENYLAQPAKVSPEAEEKLEQDERAFLSRLGGLFSFKKPTKEKEGGVKYQKVSAVESGTSVNVPQTQFLSVQKTTKSVTPGFVKEERVAAQTPITPSFTGQPTEAAKAAQFSTQAAPPNPPFKENTITGQVLDSNGKIVESAILEIQDAAGRPVRALKTNKLGHFIVVTPLQNGLHKIVTEKEGLVFDPINFETKGEIIPPILIKAKNFLPDDQIQSLQN